MKIVIFTGMKNRYMLHGRVFVMYCVEYVFVSGFFGIDETTFEKVNSGFADRKSFWPQDMFNR